MSLEIMIILVFNTAVGRLRSISGHFTEDKISGRVTLDYYDGTFSVGFARENKLLGIVRNFATDDFGKMKMNITTVQGDKKS